MLRCFCLLISVVLAICAHATVEITRNPQTRDRIMQNRTVRPFIPSLPKQAVLVSHGVELYNLGTGRQQVFFTVLDRDNNQWLSYSLPPITLPSGEIRESCALICTPLLHSDGTIYITGAGGVVNRLTPNTKNGYDHSYALLTNDDVTPQFITNNQQAELIAVGDNPVTQPLIKRTINGVEVEQPFFQRYQQQLASPDMSGFDMLVEQGLISDATRKALWEKEKRALNGRTVSATNPACSVNTALKNIHAGTEVERYSQGLMRKDGPLKDEVIQIWERNNLHYPNKEKSPDNERPVFQAAERLMPGLSKQWQGRLYTREGKWKIYDERLPIYRGAITSIADDPNQVVVALPDQLYRIDHRTGTISSAKLAGTSAKVDIRGIVALDDRTFVVGNMGNDTDPVVANTLQVIVDNGDGTLSVDQRLTAQLHSGLQGFWSEKGESMVSPRIKSLAGHRNGNGSTTLYIRSKHSGAEQMVADLHRSSDGGLDVRNPHALQLADSVNSEFFAPVGDTLITSRETEDLIRTCYLPSVRQHLTAFDRDDTAAQQPTNILPELPRWLCFTGYGYDGIAVL